MHRGIRIQSSKLIVNQVAMKAGGEKIVGSAQPDVDFVALEEMLQPELGNLLH
jgi:hypothetical protein